LAGVLVGQPRLQHVGGHGPAEHVSLDGVTAELTEALERSEVFHALGHDPETEVVAEVDDRAHDRLGCAVGHGEHERLVDLDLVHREIGQPRQRRVAGPEVVDRDADTGGRQLVEDGRDPGVVGRQAGLGELQSQAAGIALRL